WGQIAGDCVDLNTENNTVADYLVECYGKFIEMGVDGFRIDTTGHISRLTFNKQFIPRFIELGEKYKSKRLNGCPFYMFGECCARFGGVIYRDQHNLSSHYYTWKSPQSLLDAYDGSQAFWDTQVLPEGHDSPVGPMALCEQETAFDKNSDNVFMKNGAWHEPDYSDASGYNVIDFPMHYNFNSAEAAVNIAKEGDHYYNDASYNVVYVDSHDYCPGPNDGTRFNGGTAQWAENLALMFTFRGIPCIYYGSEVEFMKGAKVDAGGTDMPVGQSGRAYFGHYIEGSVNASDFGEYTATGNAAQTLNADLAQHIIRLNKIRAAVPALRKGQYTFDGCSANGGFAFKRAYKDSYALVAINGGATFTNVPAGTYTDLVTGQTYQGGGSITVSAPNTQGQLRVLVKDWTGGKVGTDGQFIYASSPVAHGGSVSFSDPGASQYYTADDAIGNPSVNFSPAGGSFKTETLTVTATLAENAVSGWYKVGDNAQVNLTTAGQQKTFTVGDGMGYGDSVTVTWGAKNSEGTEFTGKATYKKVDPNAAITVYVTSSSAPYVYAWGEDGGETVELNGKWPGKQLTESTEIDGKTYYYVSFDSVDSVNVIFSNGSQQTGDITGITGDTYYSYSGDSYEVVDVVATPQPSVTLSPNGGRFTDTLTVSISSRNATSAWYKIGNGAQKYFTGSDSFTLGGDMADGESVTVTWSATDGTTTKTGSATYTQ
ncbi:MAG: starch-binding protein, partial [Muribaculaceae bacterium]|nr:starch-binding protein [Muribaculaceae bacterium]